jgi:hypothetical protein
MIAGAAIPAQADIDIPWMQAALRAAGLLPEGTVQAMSCSNVGHGLVGTSVRFGLTYDGAAPGAPASVIGKFPATDETSRQSGAALRLYLREVNFYRYIAHSVKIDVPALYASGFDPETHAFFLLLEDLTPARGGDQLAGCGVDDAAHAMSQIAALHGPRWGDPELDAVDWLGLPAEQNERIAHMVPSVADMFRERFEHLLQPEFMRAVMDVVPLARQIMCQVAKTRTVLHGDFRLDNVLFDVQSGRRACVTLDWQTIGRGCGTLDASYFLGAGLRPADRAAHERELLGLYHSTLLAHGVVGYSWDQCWHDYRKHSVNGIFMAMFSAISVAQTARGDAMFLAMARRHAQQALELDGFAAWP